MKKVELKKGKITVVITIAIACFALVTVMFMQFKVVNETDITSIETMREEELRTELANWKEKYKEADEQYQEKTAKLQEYKDKEESNTETSQLVQKELEQTNMYLGKTDVTGEGITIKLKDFTDEEGNIQSITAEDLLVIVDYLKSAGAEAISINDQRIINMSDIVDINETFIKVNGQRILAPYVIKAIGNSSYLETALTGNGGHVDEMKKIGQNISIEKMNKVKILKYDGEIKTKYIQ